MTLFCVKGQENDCVDTPSIRMTPAFLLDRCWPAR
jgi:hypothetical protein